jgi:hypothetical protein
LLLEDRRDVRLAGRPEDVDQVLGVTGADAGICQIALGQVRPHELGLGYLLESAQRPADQPEVRGSVVFVEHLREAGVVEIVFAETCGEAKRLRGDRLVLESAGVRDESGVQAERRLARQLSADRVDQPRHQLARRRGVGVYQPDRAAAVVRPVVVDPDQLLRRGRGRLEHPQPIERRAVARHHHPW